MRRAVLALLLAGCSYDWAASGTSSVDAGHDGLAPADASVADSSDGSPIDVATESYADAGPTDSGNEDEAAAADCPQLKQTMDDAFNAATTCDGGCTLNVCSMTVTDQCSCPVHICDGMSQATANYKAAVTAFTKGGCLSLYAPCGDTCPLTGPSCSIGDAASTFVCFY